MPEQPDEPPVRWKGLWPIQFPSPTSEGPVLSEEELEARIARATRVQRASELVRALRRHSKEELLRMADEAGLRHDSPRKWRKDEIADAIADHQLRAPAHPTHDPEEEIG
ncbi:hypothetical protein [Streptomyces halobius]|uniref:Rho termination factor-like protein n=1 Tax=Streptomyces halobius TaxID=2879846 RepID=A0ABY4LZY5_9ACTN|nr:hypothetical protein [Streptomyces halobius]UQA90528.1 hypothetical protein K9S39_00130 [Streptomyces halobius]